MKEGAFSNLMDWSAVAAWAAVICWLSVSPDSTGYVPTGPAVPNDKVGHGIVYGVLAILLHRALRQTHPIRVHAMPLAVVLAISYGVMLEGYQYFLPFRSTDAWDAVANSVGVCSALLLWPRSLQ